MTETVTAARHRRLQDRHRRLCGRPRERGSVVLAPARILRVTSSGRATVTPEVVAADITTLIASTKPVKDWRHWPIRHAPHDQHEPLLSALAAIDQDRQEALVRLARLDALSAALRDGVTAGSLLISATPSPPDHPRPATTADVSTSDGEATVDEIHAAVNDSLGETVARSSVRSYLNINTPARFVRTAHGRYRLGRR